MRPPLSWLTEISLGRPLRVLVLLSLFTLALAAQIPKLLCPGGIAATQAEAAAEGLVPLELPEAVAPGRYFLYRAE